MYLPANSLGYFVSLLMRRRGCTMASVGLLQPGRWTTCVDRQRGLLPNSAKIEMHDMIEVGCQTPVKEKAAYDGETPICP